MKTDEHTKEETDEEEIKEPLLPNPIEWTKELADKMCSQVLSKYLATPITGLLLYNFMTGQKESITLFFNTKFSNPELVRIGFIMGMNYDMMKVAFAEYRVRYNIKGKLNSTSCPKTKESFMNGGEVVKELLEFFKENDFPFIYSRQSKQNKVNYFKNLISDRKANIEIIKDQMRILTEQLEYENARKKVLESKVEELEGE